MHINEFLFSNIRLKWTLNKDFLQQHLLLQIVHKEICILYMFYKNLTYPAQSRSKKKN